MVVRNTVAVDYANYYELTVHYKETNTDQSVDMGKTFEAHINIKDPHEYNPYQSDKELTTWLNAKDDNGVRTNITTNAEKLLKTEEWCLGNVTDTYSYSSPYGKLGTTAEENHAVDTNFYYETGRNLLGKGVTPNATLICNGETDSSKIGALTADEVVYAGGKAGVSNYDYYLRNDSYYGRWWTLSRSEFGGYYDSAFRVESSGNLDNYFVSDGVDFRARPAVSLDKGVKISDGVGTINDPYIIDEEIVN